MNWTPEKLTWIRQEKNSSMEDGRIEIQTGPGTDL